MVILAAVPGLGEAQPASAQPSVRARAAVLLDNATGQVLLQKNPHQRLYPASTTKILTAMVALEQSSPESQVTVGKEVDLVNRDSSRAGLKPGQNISLGDLVRGLMLPSGNDAACTIAVHIGRLVKGDDKLGEKQAIEAFVTLMNEKARQLEAVDSHFVNPHGYHSPDHYTTAYDLALIARAAMLNGFFREVVKTVEFKAPGGAAANGQGSQKPGYWHNRNELLNPASRHYLAQATGIKTGHTAEAGYCLVSSANGPEMQVISVVLGSTEEGLWSDSAGLVKYGLDNFRHRQLLTKGGKVKSFQTAPGEEINGFNLVADRDFAATLPTNDLARVSRSLKWDSHLLQSQADGTVRITRSVRRGQELGRVVLLLDNRRLAEVRLLADRDVEVGIWHKIRWLLAERPLRWGVAAVFAVAAGVSLLMISMRRRR